MYSLRSISVRLRCPLRGPVLQQPTQTTASPSNPEWKSTNCQQDHNPPLSGQEGGTFSPMGEPSHPWIYPWITERETPNLAELTSLMNFTDGGSTPPFPQSPTLLLSLPL